MVIGPLALDRSVVTFGTAKKDPGSGQTRNETKQNLGSSFLLVELLRNSATVIWPEYQLFKY